MLAENAKASRIIIIRKEGLTTRDLFRNARYLDFDRAQIMNHSVAFTNVSRDGFDMAGDLEFDNILGYNITQYTLDDENEIPVLAEALASKTFEKVSMIEVKESIPTASINSISKEIQLAIKASSNETISYVMGIVGRRSENSLNHTSFVSLKQTGASQLVGDQSNI